MEAEQITHQLKAMLEDGVFMDPLLMNTYYAGRSLPTWSRSEAYADKMYREYAHIQHFAADLGDIPFSPRLLRTSLVHTVMSTAVFIANESTGSVMPTEENLMLAEDRVTDWIRKRGIASLYQIYFVVAGYDFLQPMFFHKHVYEADFLNGVRHYPYTPESLDNYLLAAMARGSVRLKTRQGERVIQPTKLGVDRFQWLRQSLEESGYLEKRIAMSYVYQFDNVEDWDSLCETVWPDGNQLRVDYLDWVGVAPGQEVLEVACGTGALTFDGGLARRVVPGGKLTAIDISSGMLEQAKRKFKAMGSPDYLILTQASVERMPYSEASFDVVLGSAFLHFTDETRAVSEMARVARPLGTVSVLQALAIDFTQPFFSEWFQPILDLARKNSKMRVETYLPTGEEVSAWFRQAGLSQVEMRPARASWVFDDPEVVVQHIVRGVSFFQSEMVYLPWDDQRTLITELIDRGRDVCRKYSLGERTITLPSVMVRGIKQP